MFKYIQNKMDQFEAWVASKLPGWKTKLLTGLGALASLALSVQDYITGIPLSDLTSPKTALLVTFGVFTLAYWTRRLSDK